MKSTLLPILAFGVGLTAADAFIGRGDTDAEVPKFNELSFEPRRDGRANETAFAALEQQESQQPAATDSTG
jgi:hypothetical protein